MISINQSELECLNKSQLSLIIDELEEECSILEDVIKNKEKEIELIKKDDEYFKKQTQNLKNELETIKFSRTYKIANKINKILRRK